LGIAGAEQTLTGAITFAGGSPAGITVQSNLSATLADFNAYKKTPLTLGAQLVETPAETGFTVTITDWNRINGGDVVAN
jgi:hypothetical protein